MQIRVAWKKNSCYGIRKNRKMSFLFIEKYGCKPCKAERKFLAKIVPDDLYVFLGVKQYSACHIIESVVYDQFDHVLEFSREYFAGDTNSFSLTVYSEN